MRPTTLIKEIAGLAVLASLIFAPAALIAGQAPAAANPLLNLPAAIRATPGCLGVDTASTSSGKQVIFAWFENRKAALAWYYSDAHRSLMKMSGGPSRPRGPLADVPDDGRPILAIASITLTKPGQGAPAQGLPPVSQIAIELYAPLPGGLSAGGRFAPDTVTVPGMLSLPSAAPPEAQ